MLSVPLSRTCCLSSSSQLPSCTPGLRAASPASQILSYSPFAKLVKGMYNQVRAGKSFSVSRQVRRSAGGRPRAFPRSADWLRTNGVIINGVAAKVMIFDRLGKKVCKIDRFCQIGIQQVPLSKNIKSAVTPLVLTPFVPFRAERGSCPRRDPPDRSPPRQGRPPLPTGASRGRPRYISYHIMISYIIYNIS